MSCTQIKGLLKKEDKTFSDIEPEFILSAAKELGDKLSKNDLKNHQLRRLYDEVKGIEYKIQYEDDKKELDSDIKAQLIFLRTHLAYAAKKNKIGHLKDFMDDVLKGKNFKTVKDFKYFVKLFEAILAYHR